MKKCLGKSFRLLVLVAAVSSPLSTKAPAQTLTILHHFSNSEGRRPEAALVASGNVLYGTVPSAGSYSNGSVFKLNIDGSGFTTLHNFSGVDPVTYTNKDGAAPVASLIMSGDTLYGTTAAGGISGAGTVFALKSDGTGFTTLCSFNSGNDGVGPYGRLALSGSTLYGTTWEGGGYNLGTVFALTTNGTSYRILHDFNGHGVEPFAGLVESGNSLYGVASAFATVFKLNTDGSNFTNLYTFTGLQWNTNGDGAFPKGELVLSGNTLYGTAQYGGGAQNGTVFKLHTDGTGFETLHSFTPVSAFNANSDGANPYTGLVLCRNTLYGTARNGGSFGYGTVFAVNTDGTGFRVLHTFAGYPNDGIGPFGGLVLSSNTLYGTTYAGGSNNFGIVFSISLPLSPPQLTLIPSQGNIILVWPTNATGFTLQSTTNLGSSAIWTTNLPTPILLNGQNVVTNPITGTQQFFRLSQ